MDNQAVQNLNKLQKTFNRVLNRYLESSDDKYFRNFIKKEADEYLLLRKEYLPAGIGVKNVEELIICFYNDLKKIKNQLKPFLMTKDIKVVIENKFNFNDFKDLGWQYQVIFYLQKIINKKLSRFIDCSLVHGSFATKDFIGHWSDLDTKFIINDLVFESAANLRYLRKHLGKLSLLSDKIDPLSHHRFSLATNFDLNYYSNSGFLPIVCYQYGLLLTGNPEIYFQLREDKKDLLEKMNNFIGYFENKVSSRQYSQDPKGWKDDLSRVLLWPSLLLEAKDIHLYKKYSFAKAKSEFQDIDFSVVDRASQWRRQWKRKNILKFYPNFLIFRLPLRLNQMLINFLKKFDNSRLAEENLENVRELTEEALIFFEKTFNLVK